MKQQVWQSQYFKRIFRTMCLVTFPVLLIALAILYATFYHSTLSYLNSITQRFLSTTSWNIHYQMNCSKKNVLKAYTSSSGTALMSANGVSAVETLRAMRDVDYFLSQDPLLFSVYFYNGRTQEIYMFGDNLRHSPLSEFFDTDAVELITNTLTSRGDAFPREIPGEYSYMEPVQTITCYYRMANGDAVVINLDVPTLFGILKNDSTVYSNACANYLVFYDRSQLVYSSPYHDEVASAQPEALAELLEKHNWAESFSDSIEGTPFHFNILSDEDTDSQIVSVIRQSDISSEFVSYEILFIAVAFVGCFVAIVATLRCSARLYSPINRLKRLFPTENKDIGDDEIEYIAQNIVNTTSRLENLFEYRKKSLPLSQSALVKQQLLYHQYSDEEFWEQCAKQELPFVKGSSFVLLYAKWAPLTDDDSSAGEQRLLCYALSNIFHELLDEHVSSQDIPFEDTGIAFLCCFGAGSAAGINDSVLNSIQSVFRQYFNLSLSFFISRKFTQPSQMHAVMHNLQELSSYQFFHAEGCILRENEFSPESLRSDLCAVPDMAALESALRAGDLDGCRQTLAAYFDALPRYTRESASASISILASKLITTMKRLEASEPAFPEINYHDFFNSVTSAASLPQAQNIVLVTLKAITEAMQAPGNDTESLLIEEILRYLEQNYQDYNLSSKSIALYHHVSVPYLNRLFKQKTGNTIAAYVKKLRLEHARQLLVSSNLSVEAIAKKVGFENTKYFYTLFKTEYGVSPSSYRINQSILDAPSAPRPPEQRS